MHDAQVETPVTAITKHSKVARYVLTEIENIVATEQTGLKIAEKGVDPLEPGDILRIAAGNDRRMMATARGGDRPKARQSVGKPRTFRGKIIFRSSRNRIESKAWYRCQPDAQRAAVLAERDGGDKRHLIL